MHRAPLNLILTGYRLEDTRKAIAFCERLGSGAFLGRRILVLNQGELVDGVRDIAGRWETVVGTNALGEFSAWQQGLEMLPHDGASVVFLNDSASTHRVFTRFRRWAFVDAARSAQGSCHVGFVDQAKGSFSVGGLALDRWVSTYCFALTADALVRLERRLAMPEFVDSCVPGGERDTAFFDHLSPDLTTHMRALLFGGGWYASAPLTAANAESFRFKARCVIAEKHLAARCRELGIELVDPLSQRPVLEWLDRTEARGIRGFRKVSRKLRGAR